MEIASARHNSYKNEEGVEYLYDVRRWWWWLGSGVWKGEGSGAKPVSRLPGHGSDASKQSEICSLRAHWPVRLTLQYTITYILLYLPTRPLLTPPLFKPVYQLPYLRRMYSKIPKRDFPKVILQVTNRRYEEIYTIKWFQKLCFQNHEKSLNHNFLQRLYQLLLK